MSTKEKTHSLLIRGLSKAQKNRVKAAAAKKRRTLGAELKDLIEKAYPATKKEATPQD